MPDIILKYNIIRMKGYKVGFKDRFKGIWASVPLIPNTGICVKGKADLSDSITGVDTLAVNLLRFH